MGLSKPIKKSLVLVIIGRLIICQPAIAVTTPKIVPVINWNQIVLAPKRKTDNSVPLAYGIVIPPKPPNTTNVPNASRRIVFFLIKLIAGLPPIYQETKIHYRFYAQDLPDIFLPLQQYLISPLPFQLYLCL